jgi:hypothetical protein
VGPFLGTPISARSSWHRALLPQSFVRFFDFRGWLGSVSFFCFLNGRHGKPDLYGYLPHLKKMAFAQHACFRMYD